MSAPAAKAFSLPVMTMQPMPSSASKASSAVDMLVDQLRVERVERIGTVEPDMPTRPLVSTMMVSYAMLPCSIVGG